MKKIYYLLFLCLFLTACSKKETPEIPPTENLKDNYGIEFVNFSLSPNVKNISAEIKFMDNGSKINLNNLRAEYFTVTETGSRPKFNPEIDSLIDIRGQKVIPSNYSILILVDRSVSISTGMLNKQKEAVGALIKEFPGCKVFLAFMDNGVTESKQVTIDDFTWEGWERSSGEKFLYKALLAKLEELYGEKPTHYPNIPHNPILQDVNNKKIMFVLTNGKTMDDFSFIGGVDYFTLRDEILNEFPSRIKKKHLEPIPIHFIYFGDENNVTDVKDELLAISNFGLSHESKGTFHQNFQIDAFENLMVGTLDSIAADYRIIMSNPNGKVYDGQELTLRLSMFHDGTLAQGSHSYSKGSPLAPEVVSAKNGSNGGIIFKGLLFGTLFVLCIYFLFQFLIPYIQYQIFLKKHVTLFRKSSASGDAMISQRCYHCKEEFNTGDQIVTKCKHTVHWECWEENKNRCPEYGSKNCNTGKHYYNKEQKSDIRNAPYYLRWMFYGLIGGMLTWVFFKIIYSDQMFSGLISGLVSVFYLSKELLEGSSIAAHFQSKISSLLLSGALLGFFLSFLFSYLIEFKKKDLKVVAMIALRSLAGLLIGFLSFLIGGIIFILVGKDTSCFWLDWIPWLFFGCSIAWLISYRTEINLKNAIIGGLISVFLSFIVLYFANFAQEIMAMFSFMIYGAGLGMAISIVHFASEKYFLRLEGPIKEREIAIYKWMSVSGGFNRVSIGKGVDCILEMNWDPADNIAPQHAILYIENERPYLEATAEGIVVNGNRELKVGQKLNLAHGIAFTIGKTTFTYIEKDK